MARMFPPLFPHDLALRPMRAGEAALYRHLAEDLPSSWHVAYDRPIPASRRRLDFAAIDPARGLLAIEVKGGLVHAGRGAFLQAIAPRTDRRRTRKSIDPFGQARRACTDLLKAAGVMPQDCPVHIAAAFPLMAQSAFPWPASAHIITEDTLAPEPLRALCETALPLHGRAASHAALERMAALLRTANELRSKG